jgi:putative intracellular protease/amidase
LVLVLVLVAGCAASQSLEPDTALDALRAKKVLIVVTSHDRFGELDRKTGYWLEEVTHFYYLLEKAGFEIDIASPKGGTPPLDERSAEPGDDINDAFRANAKAMRKLSRTMPLAQVNPDDYVVVYFAGGHGAMWDFPKNRRISEIAASIYERGYVVAAVCHGPAALLDVKLSNGQHLIAGKEVTGFSNEEESLVFLRSDVPYSLEDELERRSAGHYVQNMVPFTSYVITSDRVVTGQNPMSTDATAEAVIAALKALPRRPRSR